MRHVVPFSAAGCGGSALRSGLRRGERGLGVLDLHGLVGRSTAQQLRGCPSTSTQATITGWRSSTCSIFEPLVLATTRKAMRITTQTAAPAMAKIVMGSIA
jgi:hypothetical protein